MSYGRTSEDFNTSVGELAILMNDTFTCCLRNYEALLPYLEKKETKPKIYHKLVHINILLNKLNEELVGLRVDYVTVESYEPKRETFLTEQGRKRGMFDVSKVDRHETKSIKTEAPFSNSTKNSIASSLETGKSMQSQNLVSVDTKGTRYTQEQKSDNHGTKNIKTELQNSNEVEDLLVIPIGNGEIPAGQTFDATSNGMTVHYAGDEEGEPVAGRHWGGNAYDKPVDITTQRENNECVSLQKVETVSSAQEKNDIGDKVKKNTPDFPIISEADSLHGHSSEELCNSEDKLHGIIRHKGGRYKCILCDRELINYQAVLGHVTGKKHKLKQKTAVNNSSEVSNNSESASASSAVCCSIADTFAIVEDRHQVISMKHAVRLDDMWEYFDATFHINKKIFRIHSGQLICYLCNERIGKYVLHVKKHISSVRHLHRIKILKKIELKNKSSNKQLLDVPGILKNIIPTTQFSLENKGFFCSVCDSFCENEIVLCHMTGFSHWKKVRRNGMINGALTTTTI
ncbi:uncharacterized protein LOC124620955 [Schistocerca americana]|uniref:uncharacterized protein LOC124620955 n=1 Tax=Schistocerca americana TaxID=7009 RepID=UPI001F4F31AA|nr:uncharacterized protein LOC124620955 [Schistocerca americana]